MPEINERSRHIDMRNNGHIPRHLILLEHGKKYDDNQKQKMQIQRMYNEIEGKVKMPRDQFEQHIINV